MPEIKQVTPESPVASSKYGVTKVPHDKSSVTKVLCDESTGNPILVQGSWIKNYGIVTNIPCIPILRFNFSKIKNYLFEQ